HTIRRVIPSGGLWFITTVAGLAGTHGTNDGTGSAARFSAPEGLALDSAGVLYVADTENQTIRKITTNGTVSTIAGMPGAYGTNDGPGSTARFFFPRGVGLDGAGNLFVADYGNNTV